MKQRLKFLFEKYERVLMPVTLLVGVTVDFLTFRAIELNTAFLVLGVYVVLAGIAITLLNRKEDASRISTFLRLGASFVLQFSFGALLSASLIFYWFSGALSVSWPLLLLFAVLMATNEVFRHYYLKPLIQLSVYFFVTYSVSTLVLPSLLQSLEVGVFVLSGIVSLVFISVFVFLLSHWFDTVRAQRLPIFISTLTIFAFMNAFYFFDLIPPIPLSLRDATVAHAIKPTSQGYVLALEEENWMDQLLPGQTIHVQGGKPIFVYSAIFAPTTFHTTIFHQWQFFDERQNKWIDKDRLSFSIKGGRDGGYRGYSRKNSVELGKWRVNIETERGQTVGRVRFNVEQMLENLPLTEVIK